MPDPVADLLHRAAAGPAAVPPPDLAARARRRWRRRRTAAVLATVAAVLAVVVPTALLPRPTAPATTATPGPAPDAFAGDRLTRPVRLDGGRLLLEPLDGTAGSSRELAVADYRSAEPFHWAGLAASGLVEHVALARVTSSEPGAELAAEPAWVVVYRYDAVSFGCPMTTGTSGPLADDTRWRAFVQPLDLLRPALLWQGQGTGGCGPLPGPRVEQALRHSSVPWVETGRTATAATLAAQVPCGGGRVVETRGPGQPDATVEVVVTEPLPNLSLCPEAVTVPVQVPLPRPDVVLLPAPTGPLGQRP